MLEEDDPRAFTRWTVSLGGSAEALRRRRSQGNEGREDGNHGDRRGVAARRARRLRLRPLIVRDLLVAAVLRLHDRARAFALALVRAAAGFTQQPVDPTDTFILTVKGPADSPRVLLNREEIVGALDGVQTRMEELMKNRRDKVVFFQADNDVPYDYVVQVMDAMRGGNVEKIGLITDENLDATGGAVLPPQ